MSSLHESAGGAASVMVAIFSTGSLEAGVLDKSVELDESVVGSVTRAVAFSSAGPGDELLRVAATNAVA